MTEESQKCPLCDKDARGWPSGMAAYHIECERCGEFLISEELAMDMPGMGEDVVGNRYLLSGMARWNTLRNLKPISLMTTNVNGYISQYENLRVPDRAHKILQYLELRGKHPGSQLKVNMHLDYPFAFCRDAVEFSYYLHEFLKARGLIRCSSANVCMITPKGWEWLEEYDRAASLSRTLPGTGGVSILKQGLQWGWALRSSGVAEKMTLINCILTYAITIALIGKIPRISEKDSKGGY